MARRENAHLFPKTDYADLYLVHGKKYLKNLGVIEDDRSVPLSARSAYKSIGHHAKAGPRNSR
jgi:hypothetical protein